MKRVGLSRAQREEIWSETSVKVSVGALTHLLNDPFPPTSPDSVLMT